MHSHQYSSEWYGYAGTTQLTQVQGFDASHLADTCLHVIIVRIEVAQCNGVALSLVESLRQRSKPQEISILPSDFALHGGSAAN